MKHTVRPDTPAALLRSYPHPARDYPTALARWADLQQEDDATVNPVCRSWMLTHGSKTRDALVLVHGITNCPAQYVQLAPLLFAQGHNVLIPRIPWNGFLDRSGEALRHLTARELRAFSDAIVDIALGFGERVTAAGLSGGGVVTAWMAQSRPDVERAVVIAPSIGTVPALPFGNLFVNRLAMRLGRLLPNVMTQRVMPIKVGPPYNYFGFATRGLSAVMELGLAVMDAAQAAPPAASSIQVVINEHDTAINLPVARELAGRWRAKAGNRVGVYTFNRDCCLIHDIIDPTQPAQRTDFVYPILVDLIAPRPVQPGGAAA